MIFYFSGTGNSLQAASLIAEHNGEELVSISAAMYDGAGRHDYKLKEDEVIGFVYPVYAWAPPGIVLKFIEKLKLENYKGNYTFSVATCGGNTGNTTKVLAEALKRNGLKLDSGFSVVMPNNYIIIGDVYNKETNIKLLAEAEKTIERISSLVSERKAGVFEVVKGPVPWLMTSVINPMFNKNAIDTKKFYADDNCTSCGICERVCNCRNIKVNGKPSWGNECTQCLACVHWCPARAVQYGKGTVKKGRYVNPNVDMKGL